MNKWVVVSCVLLILAGVSSGHRHKHGDGEHDEKHRGGPHGPHGDHRGPCPYKNVSFLGGDLSTCGFAAAEEFSFRKLALRDEPLEFENDNFGKVALSMCRPLSAVPKAEQGWCDNRTQVCIMRSSGSAISAGRYPGMVVTQKTQANASAPSVLELKFTGGDLCGSSTSARMETVVEMTCAWKHKFDVQSAELSANGCQLHVKVLSRAACSLNASRAWWAKHHEKHSDDNDDDDDMEEGIMEMQMGAMMAMFLTASMLCTLCLCCCACLQRRRTLRQRQMAAAAARLDEVTSADDYPAQQAQQQASPPVLAYPQMPMMYAPAPLNAADQQQFAAFLSPQEQMEQYYAMQQISAMQYQQQQQQQQQASYVYVPAQMGRTNESSLI